MIFLDRFSEYQGMVNKELETMLKVSDIPEKKVYDAMNYSLMVGGKRIRPILSLAFCNMLGGNLKNALVVGCAIECIHTYSLIHDDLPCMDNDDLRRGKPTCHKAFDEATATLAGDGLLNFAFERLSDFKLYDNVSPEKVLNVINYIGTCSGASGMIGGQVIDLEFENKEITDIEMLKHLHSKKTGALIRCSAVSGVIVAGGDAEDIKKAEEFSEYLGLAFQIKDDILDFEGDEALLGKPIGSDIENCKSTYVSVLGSDKAKELLNLYTDKATMSLSSYGDKAKFLEDLSRYLLNRNS